MEKSQEKCTPLMQQYFAIKQQFPDTLLFFQVGDFYELFFDDAKVAATFLAITLTKRGKNQGQDIPLCGVPVHALDHYLIKLIRGGFKVALCDQVTKPQQGTVVERAVTRVFTPGTLIDTGLLDEKSASYILAFYPLPDRWGILFTELLTAQLFATSVPINSYRHIEAELIRFFPDEIILPKIKKIDYFDTYFKKMGYCTSFVQTNQTINNNDQGEDIVIIDESKNWIDSQFTNQTIQEVQKQPVFFKTLTTLYHYLKKNQVSSLNQFRSIQFYEPDDYLILDASTQKNLEIICNTQDGGRKNTLFSVLDNAKTAMGSRTIKKWLSRPLVQKSDILQRQTFVNALVENIEIKRKIESCLEGISDVERIIGRIALGRATVYDYTELKTSLLELPKIKYYLNQLSDCDLAETFVQKFIDFSPLVQLLENSLCNEPSQGFIIKKGFDLELDRLRDLASSGHQEILKLEQAERMQTDITSLKIGYTQQTGYYIEITNANLEKVPQNYLHQQTMVGRKRFITQELKQLEADILNAKSQSDQLEAELFVQIKLEVTEYLAPLRQTAQGLAYLDALVGFAISAHNNRYIAPQFNDSNNIIINSGRHPVVQSTLGHQFVPNSTSLTDQERLWIITGPNMGGKSTYLRQVAIICIMAQCGSFVPADSANLPILDRIFTRIGSGDNVAEGKSTFLIEMEETSVICTQSTKKSLVILDEVGRGTSTFDGIALAQAIIEHIYEKIKAKCLFATHYHELTELAINHSGIKNYHLASSKADEQLLFLHMIQPGTAQSSFGLEVAKLAQLPSEIIKRAHIILKQLQNNHIQLKHHDSYTQSSIFVPKQDNKHKEINDLLIKIKNLESEVTHKNKLFEHIKNIDIDSITPRQSLEILWQIRDLLV